MSTEDLSPAARELANQIEEQLEFHTPYGGAVKVLTHLFRSADPAVVAELLGWERVGLVEDDGLVWQFPEMRPDHGDRPVFAPRRGQNHG